VLSIFCATGSLGLPKEIGLSAVADPNEIAGLSVALEPNEIGLSIAVDPNEMTGLSAVLEPNDPNEFVVNLTGSDGVVDFKPKLIFDVLTEAAGTSAENLVFVAVLSLGSLLVMQHTHSALSASFEIKQVEQVHLDELVAKLLSGFVSLGASDFFDESV
jgi:hypothetical protein